MELPFQHVPHRLPIDPGRLHCHFGDPQFLKPARKLLQIAGHRSITAVFLLRMAIFTDQYACANTGFMNIQTTTPAVKYFHRETSSAAPRKDAEKVRFSLACSSEEGNSTLFQTHPGSYSSAGSSAHH